MEHILEELFYGNIDPNTTYFSRNSNNAKALKVVSDTEETLCNLLTGREKSLFLDYVNAQSEVNGSTAIDKFIAGFTLGALMIIEVYTGSKGYMTGE